MLVISVRDTGKILAEIKKKKQQTADQIKLCKKLIKNEKKAKKENPELVNSEHIKSLEKKIEKLTALLPFYSSKMLPAHVGTNIINLKVYHVFLKRLDGFEVEHVNVPEGLYVKYKKDRTHGQLFLKDLSDHFGDFIHIPDAIWREE